MSGEPVNALTYRCTVAGMVAASGARNVVEVGVYAGDLSRMVADIPTVHNLKLIDPWRAPYGKFDQAHMDGIAKQVMQWADTKSNVEVLRWPSVEAAKSFDDESLDFYHTDGCHDYQEVKADILAWLPKVRPGGILCGDNYEAESVARGVHDTLGKPIILAKGRVWMVWK
jgi:predicted O-methyltransferase YrrM